DELEKTTPKDEEDSPPASSSTSSPGIIENVLNVVRQFGNWFRKSMQESAERDYPPRPDSPLTEAFLAPGETQREQEPKKSPNFEDEVTLPSDEDGTLNSELLYQRETTELSDLEQPETIETPAPEQ